tara:strand:+ start:85 stop:690 length:606 start_codon:yes stop_codon:yes gene_type:complete
MKPSHPSEPNTTTSIDLMYLTNFNKHSRTTASDEIVDKRDVSFYRKRIFQLCKDLLRHNETNPNIKETFDQFCLTAIDHFKMMDRSEILQNEYKNLDTDIPVSSFKPEDIPDPNEFMFKKIEQRDDKIDRFVIKHITKKEPEIHLPKQKKYNLKDVKYQEKNIVVKSKSSAEVMTKKKKQNKNKLNKTKLSNPSKTIDLDL